jgi:hypothetical protein
MLADLVSRGLSADEGLLVGMDGAKALSAAVNEVFGGLAAVQRCTLHKRRNVGDHLPDKEKAWVDAKLVKAFHHPDPDLGLRNAKHLAGLLDKTHPGAANSLREGLEEMFTVSRMGIDGRLAKTLVTSNPIESMISIAGTTNRNVTRWRDGHMVLRWTAAGMLTPRRRRGPKLSEPPHRVHLGSPPKFHETRDILATEPEIGWCFWNSANLTITPAATRAKGSSCAAPRPDMRKAYLGASGLQDLRG